MSVFQIYTSVQGKPNANKISLEQLVNDIKTGVNVDLMKRFRSTTDVEQRKAIKLKCKAYTPAATFKSARKVSEVDKLTGFVTLDIDGKDLPDTMTIDKVMDILSKTESIMVAYRSLSGNGVHALFRVLGLELETDIDRYKDCVAYIGSKLKEQGIIIDEACKDVSRALILATDENCYYESKRPIHLKNIPKRPKPVSQGNSVVLTETSDQITNARKLLGQLVEAGQYVKGETNQNNRLAVLLAHNGYEHGIDRSVIMSVMEERYTSNEDRINTINSIYDSKESKGQTFGSKLVITPKELEANHTYEMLPGEYLLDTWNRLGLSLGERTYIHAPTGAGKSVLVMNKFAEGVDILLFVAPTSAIVENLANKFKHNEGVYVGTKGSNFPRTVNKKEDLTKCRILLCCPQSFSKLVRLGINSYNIRVVLDEAHNINNDATYMSKVYNELFDHIKPKSISFALVSATPTKSIHSIYDGMNVIKFISNDKREKKLDVVSVSSKKSIYKIDTLVLKVKENLDNDVLSVVYYNNKDKGLDDIEARIKTIAGKNITIGRINTDEKDSTIYESVVSKGDARGLDVITCTSILKEGTSVEYTSSDTVNILLYTDASPLEIEQLQARFRNAKSVTITRIITVESQNQTKFNYDIQIETLTEEVDKFVDCVHEAYYNYVTRCEMIPFKEFFTQYTNNRGLLSPLVKYKTEIHPVTGNRIYKITPDTIAIERVVNQKYAEFLKANRAMYEAEARKYGFLVTDETAERAPRSKLMEKVKRAGREAGALFTEREEEMYEKLKQEILRVGLAGLHYDFLSQFQGKERKYLEMVDLLASVAHEDNGLDLEWACRFAKESMIDDNSAMKVRINFEYYTKNPIKKDENMIMSLIREKLVEGETYPEELFLDICKSAYKTVYPKAYRTTLIERIRNFGLATIMYKPIIRKVDGKKTKSYLVISKDFFGIGDRQLVIYH